MKADPKQTHVSAQWKHTAPLIACRFDPQGRYVFTSAEDYSVQRWDLPTGKKTSWAAHESWVRDLVVLPDGETLVTAACDDRIIFWPATAAKPVPIREVVAHNGWVRTISVSPDGKLLATGGNDNLVKLWNAADGTLVRELAGHDSNVYSTFFHPHGKMLLSGDLSGKVHAWEIETGKQAFTFDGKDLHTYNGGQRVHYGGVRSIALSPDGKRLACCGLHKATNPLGAVNEPLVLNFDWASQKLLKKHPAAGVRGVGWRVIYLADGSFVCASGGAGGGFLLFWNSDEEKPFHKLKLKDTARAMDMHHDGIQLATVHYDRHVRISKMAPKPAAPNKS